MRKKHEGDIITTYGIRTDDRTPEQIEALSDPSSPEFKEAFLEALREAKKSLLEGRPDYAALNASIDKKDKNAA